MTITKQECYTISCDICKRLHEHDILVPHFPTEGEAKEDVQNDDWRVWKDHVWCGDCVPACTCGGFFGEHDYGESRCEHCEICLEFDPVIPEESSA